MEKEKGAECAPEVEVNSITSTEHLESAGNAELEPAQPCHDLSDLELPEREHGSPRVGVPTPIAHAMEFCFENCRIGQCKKNATPVSESDQQRCRFPEYCSIDPAGYKP